MPFKEIIYEGTDTSRGPSGTIWGRCPFDKLASGNGGVAFFDDFLSFPKTPPTTEGNWGQYAAFTSTGGAIDNDTTEVGGAVRCYSDDDGEAVVIRTLSVPFKLSQSNGRFWFEARILRLNITDTTTCFFLGLMEDTAATVAVPLVNSSPTVLADKNVVGFFATETSAKGATCNSTYKADGQTAATVQTDVATFVAATYLKLGMKYEPRGDKAGNYTLSFYVNGVRATSDYQITSTSGNPFPNDVNMGLCFGIQNAAGTTPNKVTLDWWRAAQETAPV